MAIFCEAIKEGVGGTAENQLLLELGAGESICCQQLGLEEVTPYLSP